MRVHLIEKQTIQDYISSHASGKSSFEFWLTIIKYADLETPADIQKTFGSADSLGHGTNRIVFDVGGNKYRMICKYHFGSSNVHLFVCWIGSHREYDELCKRREQYTICSY
jgi:mRNA interferase HigB